MDTFTSESVAAGHPDKICDQISDAVVDAALTIYPRSRVAVETLLTKNRVVMAGEVTCPRALNYQKIARSVIKSLGYTKSEFGFWDKSPISVHIHQQSPDISQGVDLGGAGDQGMMFGYATTETLEYMPLPIILAHRLVERMDEVREKNILSYLRPDGKSEVKIRYVNNRPKEVISVVIAVPHNPKFSNYQVKQDLIRKVIKPILQKYKFKTPDSTDIIVNGTGKWDIGGQASDTGVTGRKIIVDTYGGFSRHGVVVLVGKIQPKLTAVVHTPAGLLPKTLWPPDWQSVVKSGLHM